MSRKGTPADNAPIESFHSSLKSETFYINNELNRSNHIVIDIVEKYIKTIIIIEFNKTRLLSPCKIQRINSLEHGVLLSSRFKGSVPSQLSGLLLIYSSGMFSVS